MRGQDQSKLGFGGIDADADAEDAVVNFDSRVGNNAEHQHEYQREPHVYMRDAQHTGACRGVKEHAVVHNGRHRSPFHKH